MLHHQLGLPRHIGIPESLHLSDLSSKLDKTTPEHSYTANMAPEAIKCKTED